MDGRNRNTLPKKERLYGKTGISRLLAKGRHGSVPGLRYLCLAGTGADVDRMMVSVPKKMFKRAVKRNLLKRRIRESWRRQKHLLTVGGGVDLLFMYPSKEILSYEEIYAAVGRVIEALNARYGTKASDDPSAAGQECEAECKGDDAATDRNSDEFPKTDGLNGQTVLS